MPGPVTHIILADKVFVEQQVFILNSKTNLLRPLRGMYFSQRNAEATADGRRRRDFAWAVHLRIIDYRLPM